MKKIILNTSSVLLLAGLFLLSSCKKSNDAEPGSFSWTHAGKTYQPTIYAAYLGTGYTFTPFHIIAGFGTFPSGFTRRVDFHLTSFAVGTYTVALSPGSANTLDYIDDGGFNLAGTAGTLNITANANNRMSGNFSVTVINPSMVTSPITGSFTDITINP
jgi:hypothetical protein